jgi:hypothetical protein
MGSVREPKRCVLNNLHESEFEGRCREADGVVILTCPQCDDMTPSDNPLSSSSVFSVYSVGKNQPPGLQNPSTSPAPRLASPLLPSLPSFKTQTSQHPPSPDASPSNIPTNIPAHAPTNLPIPRPAPASHHFTENEWRKLTFPAHVQSAFGSRCSITRQKIATHRNHRNFDRVLGDDRSAVIRPSVDPGTG